MKSDLETGFPQAIEAGGRERDVFRLPRRMLMLAVVSGVGTALGGCAVAYMILGSKESNERKMGQGASEGKEGKDK